MEDKEDIESIDNFTHRSNLPLNFIPVDIQNCKNSNLKGKNINSQDNFCMQSIHNNPSQGHNPMRNNNQLYSNKENISSSPSHQMPNTNRNNYHMTNPSFITANNNSSYFNINTYRNNDQNSNRDYFKNNTNSYFNKNLNNPQYNEFNSSDNYNIYNLKEEKDNAMRPQFHINSTNRSNSNINCHPNNNLLFNEEDSQQSEETMYTNILDILEFDREFINFSVSFPGEILTCEMGIKNTSNIDACFEVAFNQQENLLKIFKKYYQSDIKEVFDEIPNSQANFGCFTLSYLEENNNLSDMNKIRIFIKRGTSVKVILCLKTPQIKKKITLFSCLEFSLILNNDVNFNPANNNSSMNEMHDFNRNHPNPNNFNNYNSNMNKLYPSQKFLLKNEKYFKYFMPILGSVEIPKLLCLKELSNEKAKFPFISLLLEIKSKGQKFKIPFKNFSLKDIEMELIFEKMPANNTVFCFGGKFYECQFICFPNKLTIPSHGICEVDLIAKIKKFKMSNNENFDLAKIGNKIRKVLIAKIKNASVYYSFFIEASFTKKRDK